MLRTIFLLLCFACFANANAVVEARDVKAGPTSLEAQSVGLTFADGDRSLTRVEHSGRRLGAAGISVSRNPNIPNRSSSSNQPPASTARSLPWTGKRVAKSVLGRVGVVAPKQDAFSTFTNQQPSCRELSFYRECRFDGRCVMKTRCGFVMRTSLDGV